MSYIIVYSVSKSKSFNINSAFSNSATSSVPSGEDSVSKYTLFMIPGTNRSVDSG